MHIKCLRLVFYKLLTVTHIRKCVLYCGGNNRNSSLWPYSVPGAGTVVSIVTSFNPQSNSIRWDYRHLTDEETEIPEGCVICQKTQLVSGGAQIETQSPYSLMFSY